MSSSIRLHRLGSGAYVLVSAAALAAFACSGKSDTQKGTGGSGPAGGSGGAAGGSSGKGGASGSGGATGGSAGKGSGGASGGSAGSGGIAGSGGSSAGMGGAGSGGAGSGGVAGEGGEGGMTDDRPVLERPVREELECDVTTPLRDLEFTWAEGDLAATSSGAFLLWGQPSEVSAPDSVRLASIDETGSLGTSTPIGSYTGAYSSRPRLAASSRGMTVAWTEAGANEMSRMRLAELDATGAVTKTPFTVAGLAERLSDVAVAPTANGNALLFVNTTVDYSSYRVRFALLDADGAIMGDVTDLATQGEGAAPLAGALIALPNGFAATHSAYGTESETYLTFLDATGAVQGEPILLGTSRPHLGQSLLVRGGELIVAFGDEDGGYESSDIAGWVGLARFDIASRTQKGSVVRVQTPTEGEETVNPVLFAAGGDVGLMWSRGSVIYICAGCMPDNHLEAVVMDGDDFTPISAPFTFPNDQPMGGFIRPLVAPVGDHFVVSASLRFHVSGNAASAAFRCTQAP